MSKKIGLIGIAAAFVLGHSIVKNNFAPAVLVDKPGCSFNRVENNRCSDETLRRYAALADHWEKTQRDKLDQCKFEALHAAVSAGANAIAYCGEYPRERLQAQAKQRP